LIFGQACSEIFFARQLIETKKSVKLDDIIRYMSEIIVAFLIGIGLSAITVFGDAMVKHASLQNAFSGWKSLLLGAISDGFL